MELIKLDFKTDNDKNRRGLSEKEKKSISNFQIACQECKDAFEKEDESLLLMKSETFKAESGNNKFYPNFLIDELKLIENLLMYMNNCRNPDFIRNILDGLLCIFKVSDYAVQKFIKEKPVDLLLMALNEYNVEEAITTFQIIQIICRHEDGIEFIITSPIIDFCFSSVDEFFQIIENDERQFSSKKDCIVDLLNIFAEIVKESPHGTEESIPKLLDIVHLCFNSQHFHSFIQSGAKILAFLLQNNFYAPVAESGLFKQAMDFLKDPSLRPNYIYCLTLATYMTTNPPDIDFIYEKIYDVIGEMPIDLMIYQFLKFNERELARQYLTIFSNIIIMSSDYLQIFIDFSKDEEVEEPEEPDEDFINRDEEEEEEESGEIVRRFPQEIEQNKENHENEKNIHLSFIDFMKALMYWMEEGNLEIRKCAYRVAWGMLYAATTKQKLIIFETNVLDKLEDCIDFDDEQFIIDVEIRSIERTIKSFRQQGRENTEPFDMYISKMKGFVEEMYHSDNQSISKAASAFFKEYYPVYEFSK